MTARKISDFPDPKLQGRQEVREILDNFYEEMYYTVDNFNPKEILEKLANDLIDIAVKESLEKVIKSIKKAGKQVV